MSPYQPVDCERHDYLEIACLYRYRLRIELVDGRRFEARALDTRTSPEKEEFLLVEGSEGRRELRLDRLQSITALDRAALFTRIELQRRSSIR